MVNGISEKGLGLLLRPLQGIEATYRAFALAEQELVRTIGVPICVEKCGKCCQTVVPLVWEAEAKFAVSWLLGASPEERDTILSVCEGWLLDRDPRLPTHGLKGVLTQEQWNRLRPEVDVLTGADPRGAGCPFLGVDKTCSVHEIRGLECRF